MPTLVFRLFHAVCMALLLAVIIVAPARAQDGGETASEAQEAPSNIEKRLRRIEDSLIDMRAMIGALQSFAPGDGGATQQEDTAAPDGAMPETGLSGDAFAPTDDPLPESQPQPSAGPSPELQQLEIQVQALSSQLSETVKRLNRLEAALNQDESSETEMGAAQPPAEDSGPAPATEEQDAAPDAASGFGTTTVEPPAAPEDDMGEWAEEPAAAPADQAGNPDAQALFTQAYDALRAQDYAAARDGFQTFLDTYADDPLANDARYWLADAAFAEGDYVVAANNFVKVYNTAPTGEKSEETLLKLAVVLRRLDRPESACDALRRLDGRLESMPDNFRQRVNSERRRSDCG